MPKSVQEMVGEFHDVFRHPKASELTPLSVSLRELRLRLIAEEFEELIQASGFRLRFQQETAPCTGYPLDHAVEHIEGTIQNPVEMADALGDLAYVIYGMAHCMGIDLDAVVKEIHDSNMSKLGEDGKPILREDGKILKGPNYRKPDIAPVIGWTSGIEVGAKL